MAETRTFGVSVHVRGRPPEPQAHYLTATLTGGYLPASMLPYFVFEQASERPGASIVFGGLYTAEQVLEFSRLAVLEDRATAARRGESHGGD